MRKIPIRDLCLASMVAALYAVLSYFGSFFGLSYGPIQCRFAEALCVLPFLFPSTAPGLFVGCLITNLMSTVGALDIVFGSLATLLAACWTAKMPVRALAPLPPVICNAVFVGALIAATGMPEAFWEGFWLFALQVGAGELAVMYLLGLPLLLTLKRQGLGERLRSIP